MHTRGVSRHRRLPSPSNGPLSVLFLSLSRDVGLETCKARMKGTLHPLEPVSDTITDLLQAVNKHAQAFQSGDLKAREATIAACRALASTLETPSEAVIRQTWVEVRL
jgi:hypothetical protein